MPEQVRDAADALKSAIDSHLAACAARTGESDPAVLAAYDALRAAAERYDDVLFDAYDEVTPFEFVDVPDPDATLDGPVDRIGVYLRRDYAVVDEAALLRAGRAAAVAGADEDGPGDVDDPGQAVYELVNAHGVDGLDTAAEDAGLDPLGGSVWVLAQDAADDSSLVRSPFGDVDEERLLHRLDEVVEG